MVRAGRVEKRRSRGKYNCPVPDVHREQCRKNSAERRTCNRSSNTQLEPLFEECVNWADQWPVKRLLFSGWSGKKGKRSDSSRSISSNYQCTWLLSIAGTHSTIQSRLIELLSLWALHSFSSFQFLSLAKLKYFLIRISRKIRSKTRVL